jgi:tripartite ATP-independent transporter DctM subunit
MMLGLPVATSFIVVNVVGAWIFMGGMAGLELLTRNAIDGVVSFSLVPIGLFILMGEGLYQSGLASKAVDAVDRLIRRLPGRLAIVSIIGGTLFSALSGSSVANAAMLGSTLVPQMMQRRYHPVMSIGPILGTGGIAILIPPSALTVLLGSLSRIPIAELLIAGIVPGLLIAGCYVVYVVVRCALNPALAPSYDEPPMSWKERLLPTFQYVLPLSLLFVVVVGSMLSGIASPSEASALGATAALLAILLYGRMSWKVLSVTLAETAKITGMILFIMSASMTFSQILNFSGATQGVLDVVKGWQLSGLELVLILIVVYLFLGCFIDQVSIMMITLPFFVPLAREMGLDLIWFGTIMLVMLEVSLTTPPFGLLLFVMKGVVPPEVTMGEIVHAVMPYVAMTMVVVFLIVAYPPFATYLPSLL